ncbi:GspH/FimT family protein [Acaryochloris sp. IP29b_bin.137]|uniref:GspH/FimT family pseudopilin n=1 Tax=Acaryochloris sp. IP29b_bin.137 TaxID=2969217 RepID=UPI00263565F5|nr:GspH/FimT family protein [Acaryochloris sp. IP29b_bin.137]
MHQKNLSLVFYTRLIQRQQKSHPNAGMSLIEILVVIALTAMLAALAAPAVTFGNNPLRDSSNRIASSFKWARARAISSTSAVRIRPLSNTEFIMERAARCSDTTWTQISDLVEKNGQLVNEDLSLNSPVQVVNPSDNTWSICFDSKGLSETSLQLTFQDMDTNQQRTMEVFSGGAVDLGDIS